MIEKIVRDNIKKINPYVSGRTREEVAKEYGVKQIVKLASNENPFGCSDRVIKAIKKIREIHLYPDTRFTELKEALSDYTGFSEDNIIVGNGSDEIISLVSRTFIEHGDRVAIPVPNFLMYELESRVAGAFVVFIPSDEMYIDEGGVIQESKKAKIVFISSPNNPIGYVIRESFLKELLDSESLIVVDEAYYEFYGKTFAKFVNSYENLVITRTLSKAFGLAGLRVGYGIGAKETIEYMNKARIPFSISRISAICAVEALKDINFVKKTVEHTKRWREWMRKEIMKIDGVKVSNSQANFLLLDIRDTSLSSREVELELLKRGVIVRECSAFRGLGDGFIRVSIGREQENIRFIDSLKDVLGCT